MDSRKGDSRRYTMNKDSMSIPCLGSLLGHFRYVTDTLQSKFFTNSLILEEGIFPLFIENHRNTEKNAEKKYFSGIKFAYIKKKM